MIKGNEVIEIKDGVFWLGVFRDEQLELNVYLRTFTKEDKTIHMIIDPGPPVVFDTIQKIIEKKIGSIKNLNFVYLNHQDPDVSFNTLYLSKFNPRIKVICTEDTWRLVNFMGLKERQFLAIDKFKSLRGRLSTGHALRFVPSPFCHFRGAAMLYDEESRVLFSGDLFGGLTYSNGLFATSVNWHGMRLFHQMYMPSQIAIRNAIDAIRNLKPQPEIIAPQHGALIKGDLIEEFMDKLYDLPVGPEILNIQDERKEFYIEAINEIIDTIRKKVSPEVVDNAFKKVNADPSFPNLFELNDQGQVWNIKVDPAKSFQMLAENLQHNQPQQVLEIIKTAILKASVDWNLPLYETFQDAKNGNQTDTTIEVI